MSTQITVPPAAPIGEKTEVFEALTVLSYAFRDLPTPYVTIHSTKRSGFDLQMESPQDFELWRAALGIDSAAVELKSGSGSVWLDADFDFRGIPASLSGFGVSLSREVAETRQAAPADASQVAA